MTSKMRIAFISILLVFSLVCLLQQEQKKRADLRQNTFDPVAYYGPAALALYKPFSFVVDFYGFRWEGNSSEFLNANILVFGALEKPVLYFLRDITKKIDRNKSVFIDVGANFGQYSLFLSRYVNEVHSFEPYPPVLKQLERHIEINNVKNVTIHPVGLGIKTETLTFFEPKNDNAGKGTFASDILERAEGTLSNKIELNIIKGDEVITPLNLPVVSIVKVDVEGFEKNVLLGLKETLNKYRPIIVFELNLGIKESFLDRDDFIATFPSNYEFYRFAPESNKLTGVYRLLPYQFSTTENQINLTAIPKEKQNLIKLQGECPADEQACKAKP